MFRSEDGVTWSEVELDRGVFDATDGFLGQIVDQGDRLVTTSARLDGDSSVPAMFESLDRGETWQLAADSGSPPTSIVAAGQTLIGVNVFAEAGAVPLAADAAGAWAAVDVSRFAPPFVFAMASPRAGGPRALISLSVEPTVEYCYEHVDECDHGSATALLLVDEDGTVVSVDLGIRAQWLAWSALVRADGSLVIATYDGDRLVLRTWNASDGDVPTVPDVAPFRPTGPPVVRWDASLEVGTTYRFPLGTHCGIDVLGNFNGQHWWLVGEPSPAYDGLGSNNMQRILGEITMIDDHTIEYRLDGELLAVYAPRPDEPPGCA
jgi:hypothetical protein